MITPDYTPAQEEPTPDSPAAQSSSNINHLDDYFAIEEEYYNYLGNNFISTLQDNKCLYKNGYAITKIINKNNERNRNNKQLFQNGKNL